MSYPRVRPSYDLLEQGASTLAGAGANVNAAPTTIGPGQEHNGFHRLFVTATVAAFVRLNGTPANNGAGATGYPIAANTQYVFEGPISSFSFNGATAGTVAWVGIS